MKDTDINSARLSKYMTLISRYHAKVIGIKVDIHGWAGVDELIEGIGRKYTIDRKKLWSNL